MASTAWKRNNHEAWALIQLRCRINTKRKAIHILGGECVVCGETDLRLLTVNHINGDGHEDRQNHARRRGYANPDGIAMYRAINQGKRTTDDLDVRCFNHNILYEYELGRRQWTEEPAIADPTPGV